MGQWLVKTEPGEYSFGDLQREGRGRWDGVRNAQALQHLRAMVVGDEVFVYHSGRARTVVGTARVVGAAYPDPGADDPRFIAVDLEAGTALVQPVALQQIKADPLFADSPLVRQGRLSVVPLTAPQARRLLSLGTP